MKLIIDIDERAYAGCVKLKNNDDMGILGFHLINATANGTPLEEKTGHWKKISPAGIMECSVCGGNVLTSDIEAYKYCHHCGAKMERENE